MSKNEIPQIVAKLLLDQRRHKLPINPIKLDYPFLIHFTTVRNYCENSATSRSELDKYEDLADGITIVVNRKKNIFIVVYNENISARGRKRFTLAHEVGHIMLKHTTDDELGEKEADAFAAELLMPRALILETVSVYGTGCISDICRIFKVSKLAAKLRLENIQKEETITELEKRLLDVYKNLLPAINKPIIEI